MRSPSIESVLAELTVAQASLELFVDTVNAGPKGSWTPDLMAELARRQSEYAAAANALECHPDRDKVKSSPGRTVGARRK